MGSSVPTNVDKIEGPKTGVAGTCLERLSEWSLEGVGTAPYLPHTSHEAAGAASYLQSQYMEGGWCAY